MRETLPTLSLPVSRTSCGNTGTHVSEETSSLFRFRLGSWHLEAAFELSRIGLALAERSSGDEKVVVTHFFQRLAVFLQRGNAHLILSRQPTFPERHVGRRLTSLVVFVFVLFRILFNRN